MPTETSPAQGEQRRRIVDAQIHLWKAETPDWKWVPGRPPQMPEPFTIEKTRTDDGRGRGRRAW